MVNGLNSLLNSDDSMMLKLLKDVSSLEAYKKANETKEKDDNSVEDVFSQIIDQINEQIEKMLEEEKQLANKTASVAENASANDTSNFQFGPPPWLKIEGLEELMV